MAFSKAVRCETQRPRLIRLTGLNGSGKATITHALQQHLAAAGQHTYLPDGDNVRRVGISQL